jgi:hypothetical protein
MVTVTPHNGNVLIVGGFARCWAATSRPLSR